MNKSTSDLLRLETALDIFLREYRERLHLFDLFPRVDIERVFVLWDDYLAFLEQNKHKEEEARLKFERERGKRLDSVVHIRGNHEGVIQAQYQPFWKSLRENLDKIFGEGYTSRDVIDEVVESAFRDRYLSAFFDHDISHIRGDLLRQFWNVGYVHHVPSVNRMRHHRDAVRKFLELYNQNPEFLFGAHIEPYKMLHFITTAELGKPPRQEAFDPSKIAWQVAFILQNRYPQEEYSLTTRLSDSKANEIAVDAESFQLMGNSGVVFSIIYNLAKNAYKKFTKGSNTSEKIFIQVYEAPFSTYVITVGDNGTPVDINAIKDKVRNHVLKNGIDNVVFPTERLKRKISGWRQSDYRVGELTINDIVDVACMARMSGFDNPDPFSSGMGLYGTRYLVEKTGGKILYGEDFDTGGPLFTFIVPKKLPTNTFSRALNVAASRINGHNIYTSGYVRQL